MRTSAAATLRLPTSSLTRLLAIQHLPDRVRVTTRQTRAFRPRERLFSFTAGGPFVKDRLFWFASLERAAQASPETLTPFGTSTTTGVPTTELLWSAKVDAKLSGRRSERPSFAGCA